MVQLFLEVNMDAENEDLILKWNVMLCEFALNGPTYEIENKVLSFSSGSNDELAKEAGRLHQIICSPLYQFLFTKVLGNSVKLVKPRII